eukprot:3646709-Rhodomonas_salina.1
MSGCVCPESDGPCGGCGGPRAAVFVLKVVAHAGGCGGPRAAAFVLRQGDPGAAGGAEDVGCDGALLPCGPLLGHPRLCP